MQFKISKEMKNYLSKANVLAGFFVIFLCFLAGYIWLRKNYPMKLQDYTKYALYMALLDDEIMRKELGEEIEGKEKLRLPDKAESLKYRYSLFLEYNKGKREEEIKKEILKMEERLGESKIIHALDRPM